MVRNGSLRPGICFDLGYRSYTSKPFQNTCQRSSDFDRSVSSVGLNTKEYLYLEVTKRADPCCHSNMFPDR